MFGFSKNVAGMAITPSAVSVVRVSMGKGFSVSGQSSQPLSGGVLSASYTKNNIADPERFMEAMKAALAGAGVKGGDISVAIPDQVVKVALMDLKGEARKAGEIIDYVKWRAKKFLPYDPEAAKIDYHVSGDTVLALFANMEVVTGYEEALCSISMRPVNISVPSIALFNLFTPVFGAWKEFVFISVLRDAFSVIVARGGSIDFHRSMDIGYSSDRLIQEIASSLTFYMTENEGVVLRKLFLSPGMDESDALAAHLADATGMEVEILRISSAVRGAAGVSPEGCGPAIAAAVNGL